MYLFVLLSDKFVETSTAPALFYSDHSTFQIPPDSQYDRSLSIRLPSTTSGNG